MSFFDKELLVSAGLGGLVGLAVGAASLKKKSPSSDLYWFAGLGVVVAAGAAKLRSKPAPGHHVGHFERPGWPFHEHGWDPAGYPEHTRWWDAAGWPHRG